MPRPENAALFQRYRRLADQIAGVHFVGRLATYRYYNMDQVVGQALALYAKLQLLHQEAAVTAVSTTPGTARSIERSA